MEKIEGKEGYKKTELGLVPVEWDVVKLRSIVKTFAGGTPKRNNLLFYKGEIPWVKSGEVNQNYIFKTEEYISKLGLEESSAKMISKGSILMALYGATAGQVSMLMIEAAANQAVLSINSINKKVINIYIYHYLKANRNKILSIVQGSGQPNLSKEIINNVYIPLPLPLEQQKIARILSCWDKAIEKTEKLINARTKLKKGLMQKLLTGKKRFKEFIKSQSYKKTEIGKLPEDWQILKASDIFKNYSDKNHPEEELLSATQDKGVLPRNMLEGRVMMPEGDVKTYKLVNKGDFVISLRSFQGGIEHSEYRGIVSPAYTVLKNIIPIEQQYYKYLFKSVDFISRLSVAVIGIRDGKQISYNDFAELSLYYPSIEEQQKIASVLSTCDREMKLLENKLNSLKNQKKGLMQKLLTGQIRVTVV
ncbi:MAG: restriction endonuclease subunit S [Candidatus Eremiobacterota bacterium]